MLDFNEIKLKIAINSAFLKQKSIRKDIDFLKVNLKNLLDNTLEAESEEHNKNVLSAFLRNKIGNKHYINTRNRTDLVIYEGEDATSPSAVLIECKKLGSYDMVSKSNFNRKSLHELIFYFLNERIIKKNLSIKHLIITNNIEWFIFDAQYFDNVFARNKELVKKFNDVVESKTIGNKSETFYNDVAFPFIKDSEDKIEYCYFNLKQYEEYIENDNDSDDVNLVELEKILSKEHLLRLPFANDSNSLNLEFYNELLHIIGLEEVTSDGRILIQRLKEGERIPATILEEAISQLDSLDKISRIDNREEYGDNYQSQLFNVALELTIMWLNRILFLKLLESQLVSFNKSDKNYSFLNLEKIKEYDDLNTLFYQVLAKEIHERNANVKTIYEKVPYLNSSLFEPSELEHQTIFISNLSDNKEIPIFNHTVLKDRNGNRVTGKMKTLEYLLRFLDSYDFSSEAKVEIQEDNKQLINAAVLGNIFEKINGYKDGSFFTPSLITMYIVSNSLRQVVIDKFNTVKSWNCKDFTDLYNKIDNETEANDIVNSIKVCDPAVGSGHFLVSILNEFIAIKGDLRILMDKDNKRLKNYFVEIKNDDIIIRDSDGEFFYYNPKNPDSQRVQETIFKEKQTIIENCLFGADINPNSVNICRLRLWIELLKHAYYNNENQLETLPNIDINIKIGNSLINKFDLFDSGITAADRRNLDEYKLAVKTYKNVTDKSEKREIKKSIEKIRAKFRGQLGGKSKDELRLNQLVSKLERILSEERIGGLTKKENDEIKNLEKTINELKRKIDSDNERLERIKTIEWRFDYPELLDDSGKFTGFDIVVGNPPYIQMQKDGGKLANQLAGREYLTYDRTGDIYAIFYERGWQLLKENGVLSFITSNKWMRASYGESLRKFLSEFTTPLELIDLGGVKVFDSATVDTNILILMKQKNSIFDTKVTTLGKDYEKDENLRQYVAKKGFQCGAFKTSDVWIISNPIETKIREKIEAIGTPLKDWDINIYRGVLTGYNQAFIIDGETKNRLIAEDPNSAEILKPILRGRDVKRYKAQFADLWLINIPKGFTIKSMLNIEPYRVSEPMPRYGFVDLDPAWAYIKSRFPAVANHLIQYIEKAENRIDQGDYWWELRACAYLNEFEKEKIVFSKASKVQAFLLDNKNYYLLNTSYFFAHKYNKYLVSVLNSKLFRYIFLKFYQGGGIFGEITIQSINVIPIPKISENEQAPFIKLVDEIIALKEMELDSSKQEQEIDHLVYKLYDLTEEEIKIVEGAM